MTRDQTNFVEYKMEALIPISDAMAIDEEFTKFVDGIKQRYGGAMHPITASFQSTHINYARKRKACQDLIQRQKHMIERLGEQK